MLQTLDIVIPVLNEAATLQSQIKTLLIFLNGRMDSSLDYQVTIADNGSTDRTVEIANGLAGEFERIRVVSVGRRGVGLALKEAWSSSHADYVGYMDLDFSTDLAHLIDIERGFASGFDCLFGTRLLPASLVTGRPFKRELTSKVFNYLIRKVFHSSLSDGMCGFKFFRRELLPEFFRVGAQCDGWFFCTEITVAAQLIRSKIHEIPVNWNDDATSKVRIPSLTLEYLSDILAFRKRIKAARKSL